MSAGADSGAPSARHPVVDIVLPRSEGGSPLVGPWLEAVREARRVASSALDAHAGHLVGAWSAGHGTQPPLAPPVVVVGRARLWIPEWSKQWFAKEETRLADVVRRRLLRRPLLADYEPGAMTLEPVADGQDVEPPPPWTWLDSLMHDAPYEFADKDEDRAVEAEHVAAEELLQTLVGAINRLTEQRGEDRVVVLLNEDDHVAPGIDRWWPEDVRPGVRELLT